MPSPAVCEAIEERLDGLDRLQRKHGGSIEAVLAHAERCRELIAQLANADEHAERLAARLARGTGTSRRAGAAS